jgi:hypothetical protein
MKTNFILKTVLLGVTVGLLAQSSYGTISYGTISGAAANCTADITISGTSLTIKLSNLTADPGGAANLLNGVRFNLAGVTGASGLTANAATLVTIASDNSYVTSAATGATIASEWTLSNVSSLITLSSLGSTGPDYLIIGPAGYAAANGSLAGNGPHNPFILGNETFQFNLSGANSFSESDITGLTFLFGTSTDSGPGREIVTVVPEPSTIVAGALLLLPFGISTFRILRKNRAA